MTSSVECREQMWVLSDYVTYMNQSWRSRQPSWPVADPGIDGPCSCSNPWHHQFFSDHTKSQAIETCVFTSVNQLAGQAEF